MRAWEQTAALMELPYHHKGERPDDRRPGRHYNGICEGTYAGVSQESRRRSRSHGAAQTERSRLEAPLNDAVEHADDS